MKRVGAVLLAAVLLLVCGASAIPAGAADTLTFAPQTAQNDLLGKTVAGYQAWFRTDYGTNWFKMGNGVRPVFDIWPGVEDYPAEALFPTAYETLRNGQPALLFNSTAPGAIDTHFRWMETYGIDGAAVQRFVTIAETGQSKRANYLSDVMASAEAHGRLFYMMYDFSDTYSWEDSTLVTRVKRDFVNNIEARGLTASTAYAHADGKPVVCLWGLGPNYPNESPRYPGAKPAGTLVEWFQRRGYYVIIGTHYNQFSAAPQDYAEVFELADMISPWYVGRYRADGVDTVMRDLLTADTAYCKANDIAFMPVIYPGFSWANLFEGEAPNWLPRDAGRFYWEEAKKLAAFGCDAAYLAMFDEYNESTAIMKAASDAAEIPAGPDYYLTLSADGYWLSQDYYLRLAGKIAAALKDVAAGKLTAADMTAGPEIDFSEGPVFYRNGFAMYDLSGTALRLDPAVGDESATVWADGTAKVYSFEPVCEDGEWVGDMMGAGSGTVCRTVSVTRFTLAPDTVLTCRVRAGKAVTAVRPELIFADGSRLSDRQTARPEATADGEWVTLTLPVSNDLAGERVTAIALTLETDGDFSLAADDLLVTVGDEGIGDFAAMPADDPFWGDADGSGTVDSTDARLILQYYAKKIPADALALTVCDVDGSGTVDSTDARLILQLYAKKIDMFPIEKRGS